MTNHECATAVLAAHREARHWSDEAVATDLMVKLGLDPAAVVSNPLPEMANDDAAIIPAAATI